MQKLVLNHIYPPIPDRRFDWGASLDDDPERGYLGFGRTPTEAVQEALASEPDLFEAEDWTVTVVQPTRAARASMKGAA